MKNRFSLMGQTAFGMFLALSAFGMFYSCSDDYVLDDTTPSFLGGSIYDELVARGNFQNTVRLIEDLDYKDVLAKTGSKTLFVANDDAYKTFFANQTVFKTSTGDYVRSYEQLSLAQKKRLLNNAMLNNAYVLEMMANCADGDKNLCLRQTGAASAVDSVAWWGRGSLPQIQSETLPFGDFWSPRIASDKAGLFIPEDAAAPLVTHFLEGQMREKSITHDDISFLFNLKQGDAGYWANADSENRSYVYDAQIVDQDVVCMNGYFHVLDKVLVAPSNMAEEIRNNGETNLFSRILDRFSAPYYNAQLTENYNALAATPADSVFERRYIAQRGPYGQIANIPGKNVINVNTSFPFLTFDPAWTEFKSADSEAKEKNMGAMFVPNDKVLADYFLSGAGRVLMDRYATKPNTRENLEYNMDQIPLDIIQALVNNLMKPSFNETVPSKYLTIMNDARDQMFPTSDGYTSVEAYKAAFDKTILANNGVVYVMNRVLSPADYASVIAPALYCANTQVMRSVVRADDNYIQGSTWSNAPLQKYFSTYLKAMQSRFSFFVPTDEGLGTYGYIDPATFVNKTGQLYWRWTYNSGKAPAGKRVPVDAVAYPFNVANGQDIVNDKRKGNDYRSLYNDVLTSTYGEVKKNLLVEMVNQHIVVHANNDNEGVRGSQRIYLSREGAPVIVKNNIKGVGMQVSGGLQEQLTKAGYTYVAATPCTVTEVYDQSAETNGYGNGMTYLLDRPMQPTTVTTYKAIDQVEGTLFKSLCEGATKELLQQAGFRDALIAANKGESDWNLVAQLYMVFLQGNAMGTAFNVPSGDKLVRFFNNYKYTVYVPTNAAIEAEIANGLPTWESIQDFLDANLIAPDQMPAKPEEETGPDWETYRLAVEHNDGVKAQAQAMVNTLVNFLKYHFQDESVFVDNVTANSEVMTAAIANDNYVNLRIAQTPGKMTLTDATGRTLTVDAGKCNVFARETHFNNATTPRLIESSSYVAVHQLAGNQALHYKKVGKWSDDWATPKKAKAFLAKYGTQK
ncbi:MAG: hypothetical protein Q4D23_00430 [Bacteroidales bacterium]|nr:hypothetical protein [Bacteroidales bacterium]